MNSLNELLQDNEETHSNFITQFCKPIKILGKGAFSTVIEALNTMSNKKVAIKIINKQNFNSAQINLLRNEAQLLNSLNHPHIVRITFNKETKNKLFIVMDLIEGVTLTKFMKKSIDEKIALIITKQLLDAIQYLHQRDIIHRDIKPENILISQKDSFISVTIIDFGLSAQLTYLDGTGLLNDNCGTLLYMAPELVYKKPYNRSVDIWALGIVVFNLLNNGQHPFFNEYDDSPTYSEKIKWMQWNWRNSLDDKIINFLIRTVAYLPEERLTVSQCLQHPWITGTNNSDQPFTLIEILKSHSLFEKIKILIQGLQFFIYLKDMSFKVVKPKVASTPKLQTIQLRHRLPSIVQNSTSADKVNRQDKITQITSFDSGSSISNRSQYKLVKNSRKLIQTKSRNSCEQVQHSSQEQRHDKIKIQKNYRSLDKTLRCLSTTASIDSSLNQSNLFNNKIEQQDNMAPKPSLVRRLVQHLPKSELIPLPKKKIQKPPIQKKTLIESSESK